jgi:RimJ/RimL family protein N-acetyltransferase
MADKYAHIPGMDFIPVFASAVLDGFIPAEVQERQGCLLISLSSGIHYAAGRAGAGSVDLLAGKLDDAEKNRGRFTLFSGSAELDHFISGQFGEGLNKHRRHSYQKLSPVPPQPSRNCEISFIELNRQSAGEYPEFPMEYFSTYWGSIEHFLESGFGIRVLMGEQAAGECVSIFRSRAYAEMDIHIAECARGNGLGAMLAARFIKTALEKNLQPRWDCSAANRASIGLAEKLGFSEPAEYHVFTLQKQS